MAGGTVVIGAGQAGVQAAEALRSGGYEGAITLLGDEPHGPYHRPPLSKAWLAGEIDADQLVMRAPENAGYGVEISGAGSLDRLQVRTVAFDSARDASGDIPAEQRWCGDFGKLQAALNAQGSEIVIEKAMGVGAVPVKVLQSTIDDDDRRGKAPSAGNKAAN